MEKSIEEVIENQIQYIRRMSLLTDDQLRLFFMQAINERPEILDTFKDAATKKTMQDIKKISKTVQGDPRRWARKVDSS